MDHAKEALRYLDAAADSADGNYLDIAQSATVNALIGNGHALLHVADAIHEQTAGIRETLLNEGVRTVSTDG